MPPHLLGVLVPMSRVVSVILGPYPRRGPVKSKPHLYRHYGHWQMSFHSGHCRKADVLAAYAARVCLHLGTHLAHQGAQTPPNSPQGTPPK